MCITTGKNGHVQEENFAKVVYDVPQLRRLLNVPTICACGSRAARIAKLCALRDLLARFKKCRCRTNQSAHLTS